MLHLFILTSPAASTDLLPLARCTSLSGSSGWWSANHSAAMQCQRTRSSSDAEASTLSLVLPFMRTSFLLPNLTSGDVPWSSDLRTSRPTRHSHPTASLSSGSRADSSSSEQPSTPFRIMVSSRPSPSDLMSFLTRAASAIPFGVRK
jgi:hypothetical protein